MLFFGPISSLFDNEDGARELAAQIRREAPVDATVHAEHPRVYLPFIGF